jgi:hypothetical protein
MKIIFLDYDGVVNNLVFHTIDGEPDFYSESLENYQGRDYKVNDFQAVAWLNKIVREFNCSIVVTSTWRGRNDYQECLFNAGFKGNILGKTPHLDGCIYKRGLEIQQWLDNHKEYDIEDFIILDDDTDMCHLMSHLIHTNTYRGLGFEEYQKICERWEKTND